MPSGQPSSELFSEPLCGSADPLGATYLRALEGFNFAVFSSAASAVSLCLFTEQDLQRGATTLEIELDPILNRTGQVWHIALPQMNPQLLYGFRVRGPVPRPGLNVDGHSFNEAKVVLDPYARAVVSRREFGALGPDLPFGTGEVLGMSRTWVQSACALPEAADAFDWEGDRPLNIPMEELVIYELHVRGFTNDPSSKVASPGTFQGVIEKLDYIQSLGVNCIELMPVHEFNELEYYQVIPGTESYRFNYWGYSTVGFFAPMARFSQAAREGRPGTDVVREFKTMVREAHKRGIEVILDVVFNHTAEGNTQGPTIAFRGLDNRVYYMIAPKGETYNYSGCGNTFNCNQPVVRQFVIDCLRYWVEEMHVDGFRFDLASILTRAHSAWSPANPFPSAAEAAAAELDPNGTATMDYDGPMSDGPVTDAGGYMTDGSGVPTGTPLSDPPLIAMISQDPVLATTKLIAEAWDCDGLNQVGAFPHFGRWSEWNGSFRDTVRNFIKGTDGWVSPFASALLGSPEVYGKNEPRENDWWGANGGAKWKGNRGPKASVNFVTAHDGFTLRDLVSYNEKHNEANGEQNRDGETHNASWNCGVEGESADEKVVRLRQRQARNLLCALFVSQGVPMLLMGDEYGHTKGGNNNTYCHDSPLNWFNWAAAKNEVPVGKDFDSLALLRFTRHLVHFRRAHPEFRQPGFLNPPMIEWHGLTPATPDWSHESRLLAFTLTTTKPGESGVYVAFNTSHLPMTLELPNWDKGWNPGMQWVPVVDTSKRAPYDFLHPDAVLSEEDYQGQLTATAPWMAERQYPMLPYSCIILEWKKAPVARAVTPEAAARDVPGLAAAAKLPPSVVAAARGPRPRVPAPNRTSQTSVASYKANQAASAAARSAKASQTASYARAQAADLAASGGVPRPPAPRPSSPSSPSPASRVPKLSDAALAAAALLTVQEIAAVEREADYKAGQMVAAGMIPEGQRQEAKNLLRENELIRRAAQKQ